jgi:phosphohistidine phosphatase
MKKLFIVRHSQAEEEDKNDFERKLTSEGKQLAKKVARNLKITPGIHSKFISSPALRAIETAQEFARVHQKDPNKIEKQEFLYQYFTTERFFMFLDTQGEKEEEIWIFSHNPMLSEIVTYLSENQILSMPKCAVAAFQTEATNWFNVTPANTKLLFFENHKNHS